jgi:hypothetical protein
VEAVDFLSSQRTLPEVAARERARDDFGDHPHAEILTLQLDNNRCADMSGPSACAAETTSVATKRPGAALYNLRMSSNYAATESPSNLWRDGGCESKMARDDRERGKPLTVSITDGANGLVYSTKKAGVPWLTGNVSVCRSGGATEITLKNTQATSNVPMLARPTLPSTQSAHIVNDQIKLAGGGWGGTFLGQ